MTALRPPTAAQTAVAAIALAALALVVSLAIPSGVPRALVALPVLALAPGWAVQTVAGRRGRGDVAIQLGLCVMLSLAMLIAVGLVLAALGIALRPTAEVVALAIVLAALAGVAYARGVTRDEDRTPGFWRPWVAAAAVVAVLGASTGGVLAVYQSTHPAEVNNTPWTSLAFTGATARTATLTSRPHKRLTLETIATDHAGGTATRLVAVEVDGRRVRARTWTASSGANRLISVQITAPRRHGLHTVRVGLGAASIATQLAVS